MEPDKFVSLALNYETKNLNGVEVVPTFKVNALVRDVLAANFGNKQISLSDLKLFRYETTPDFENLLK